MARETLFQEAGEKSRVLAWIQCHVLVAIGKCTYDYLKFCFLTSIQGVLLTYVTHSRTTSIALQEKSAGSITTYGEHLDNTDYMGY